MKGIWKSKGVCEVGVLLAARITTVTLRREKPKCCSQDLSRNRDYAFSTGCSHSLTKFKKKKKPIIVQILRKQILLNFEASEYDFY